MNNPITEQLAIKMLMDSKSAELLIKLEDELFFNQDLKNVVKLIRRAYLDKGSFPSWDVLISMVLPLCSTKDKAEFLSALLLQVKDKDTDGMTEDDLLEELKKYHRLRFLLGQTQSLIEAIESKDADKAEAVLSEAFDRVYVSSQFDLDSASAANMLGEEIKFNFKTTGFANLDERGGLIQGGFTLLGGAAKAGKSIASEQILGHIYDTYQEPVSYHSYEQSVPELRARRLAAKAEVDLGKIIANNLTAEELKKIRKTQIELYFENPKNLDVEDFCAFSLTSNDNEFSELVHNTFELKAHQFYFFREYSNWDELFNKIRLLAKTRGVKAFVIDYPWLIAPGKIPKGMAMWDYALSRLQLMKSTSHELDLTNIIAPAQYDETNDKLRFVTSAPNTCDLYVSMNGSSNDDKTLGTVTFSMKAYRNYLTVPDKPLLQDFKMMKEFHYSRFTEFGM